MEPSIPDSVENNTSKYTKIRQAEEYKWTASRDELQWDASDGRGQQIQRRQHHHSLMNIQAPPEVECRPDQDSEYQHVAQWYYKEHQRLRA